MIPRQTKLLFALVGLGLLLPVEALAQGEPDQVKVIPFSQENPTIPHPAHERAPITLKGMVREARCGTYRVWWDTNLDGNFDNDRWRDVGHNGTTLSVIDIGRSFQTPEVSRDRIYNVSVRVQNRCNGRYTYGTFRLLVQNWYPANDVRQWTTEQIETLAQMAVQENMWYHWLKQTAHWGYNHRQLRGHVPYSSATGPTLWLFIINGHLPAYPPNTLHAYGKSIPDGWHEDNNRRWNNSPYAELVMRYTNWLAQGGTGGVNCAEEDNRDEYDANRRGIRRNRLPGTNQCRGAWSVMGTNTYRTGIATGSLATVLPALAGTPVQVGSGIEGNYWEWYVQEMVDYLGYQQIDCGGGKGGVIYYTINGCAGGNYLDLSTTQWMFIGLESAEIAGGPAGVMVNNRHKYRIADALIHGQDPGNRGGGVHRGGGGYRAHYYGEVKLTGGSVVASRWLGAHKFNLGDHVAPWPEDTGYTRHQMRNNYNLYMEFLQHMWTRRDHTGSHRWNDGFWHWGDYLCGNASGVYNAGGQDSGKCGLTYTLYSAMKGFRTNPSGPQIHYVGNHEWYREFATYYVRQQERYYNGNDPWWNYGSNGRIEHNWCNRTAPTCNWGRNYMGSAMGGLTLTPTIFNPRPVAIGKGEPPVVSSGCVGGNAGVVTFDHSESFHPNSNATIEAYQWDVDERDGLWWETGAQPDFQSPLPDGSVSDTFEYQYIDVGTYTATLRIVDNLDEFKTSKVTIQVTPAENVPPASAPGGPYAVEPGGALKLDGQGLDQNKGCGDVLRVTWDLDGDGQFDDAVGENPTIDWGPPINSFPMEQAVNIAMRVEDSQGLTAVNEAEVTVYPSEPIAQGAMTPNPGACRQPVTFDGTESYAPNPFRRIVRWQWDADANGAFEGNGSLYQTQYQAFGDYNVTLLVTDDLGRTNQTSFPVSINQGNSAPLPLIAQPQYLVFQGDDLQVDGRDSADPDANCGDTIVRYRWDVNGNGRFDDAVDVEGGNPVIPWANLEQGMQYPADRGTLQPSNQLALEVTDTFGATATVTTEVVILDATPIALVDQNPNPVPISLADGSSKVFLDGRASMSPVGVDIVRYDWDLDDDGVYEVEDRSVIEKPKTFDPIPIGLEEIPDVWVRLKVTDQQGRVSEARVKLNYILPPTPPTVDADPSDLPETGYHILPGDDVELSAAQSIDPDFAEFGDFIRFYRWDLNFDEAAGFDPEVVRRDEDGNAAEAVTLVRWADLVVAGIDGPGEYPIRLEGEDTTRLTNTDDSVIVVHPTNPVADAFALPEIIACGGRTTLDGRGSAHNHPKIDVEIWRWDLDADGAYDDAEGPIIQAKFDRFTYGVPLRVGLEVEDSRGNVDRTTVDVLVEQGNRPPAPVPGGYRLGNGQIVGPYVLMAGESLVLDATGTEDPNASCGDRITRYQWDLGNDGTFEFDSDEVKTAAIPWNTLRQSGIVGPGDYQVRLRVTDRGGLTADNFATIKVVNGPTAQATSVPDRALCQNVIAFDASTSYTDGPLGQGWDLVTYKWDLDQDGQYNDGNGKAISRPAKAVPNANGDVVMVAEVQVTDASGRTDTAQTTVTIDVPNLPPVSNAGGPYTTGERNPGQRNWTAVTLDGRGSSDPNLPCDELRRYKWDTDGDGLFGRDDNPDDLEGAVVDGFVNPQWQVNTTQSVELIVCDARGACSAPSAGDVFVLGAAPPAGTVLFPRADDDICIGQGNVDVRLEVSSPSGGNVTAEVKAAGVLVATRTIATPANGSPVETTISFNPANVPQGRHFITVDLKNAQGGTVRIDSGGRLDFDRSPPDLQIGDQLQVNGCYPATGIPVPELVVNDNLDGNPALTTETSEATCRRELAVTATDACGNSATVRRAYYVAEFVEVNINGPSEGELVGSAAFTWSTPGDQRCVSGVTGELSLNGEQSVPYGSGDIIRAQGNYALTLNVADCEGFARPQPRAFQVNGPPVADPIPNRHPATDTNFPNAYTVPQGAFLLVDGGESLAPEPQDRIVRYDWDFDRDGNFDAVGATALYPTQEQGLHRSLLRVTDSFGARGEVEFEVRVTDVDPVADTGGPYVEFMGIPIPVDASASRPGAESEPIIRYVWEWGDGTPNAEGLRNQHTYDINGIYYMRLTVYDRDSSASAVTRVDVRDVAPIVNAFNPPVPVFETLPMEFNIDAEPALPTDPITLYSWDFYSDGSIDHSGLNAHTVTHQFREPGLVEVTARVRDTDSTTVRVYDFEVIEASLPALIPHIGRKTTDFINSGDYTLAQLVPILDLGDPVEWGSWAGRYEEYGTTLKQVFAMSLKMSRAQELGLDYGDELWSITRQLWRDMSRMETALIELGDEGPGANHPLMRQVRPLIDSLQVWRQRSFEELVRGGTPQGSATMLSFLQRAQLAFDLMTRASYPLETCRAPELETILDPVDRLEAWAEMRAEMGEDLASIASDMQQYVDNATDPGCEANGWIRQNAEPWEDCERVYAPMRDTVASLLSNLNDARDIQETDPRQICGRGNQCSSDAQEARFFSLMDDMQAQADALETGGVYARHWKHSLAQADFCRNEFAQLEVNAIQDGDQITGGFPAGYYDTYFFEIDQPSDVDLFVHDGSGGCPGDTEMTVFRVENGQRSQAAYNDDYGFSKCSRVQAALPHGRYEVRINRFRNLALDEYVLSVSIKSRSACGDRQIDADEECDDGNDRNGDGCSADCQVEPQDARDGGDFQGGHPEGSFDRWDFQVPENGTMTTIYTHNGVGGCDVDSRITLYRLSNNAGTEIAFDDDGGVGTCSRIQRLLQAGNYYVVVDSLGRGGLGPYHITIEVGGGCGDGFQDPGEACDDGNLRNGDGCSERCTVEANCGNGGLDAGEECDDGNRVNGDGCDATCAIEIGCGNGRIEVGETCDDGNNNDGDGCSADCQIEAVAGNCGDGFVDPNEECDDGNLVNDDGCSNQCLRESTDLIQAIEERVGSVPARGSAIYRFIADERSTIIAETSDGAGGCPWDTTATLYEIVNEQRRLVLFDDDGGIRFCARLEERIGAGEYELEIKAYGGAPVNDFVLEARLSVPTDRTGLFRGAFVPSGNDLFTLPLRARQRVVFESMSTDQAGCEVDTEFTLFRLQNGARQEVATDQDSGQNDCAMLDLELPAGDYELQVDGPVEVEGYLVEVSLLEPAGLCGNGIVDAGEQCDDGNHVNQDGCDSECRSECGNGVVDAGEECDDGNSNDFDGCSSVCASEGECGNGLLEPGEACDDGNLEDNDGCQSTCKLRENCGDGRVQAGEQCDDGNLAIGDGCDALCSKEIVTIDNGRDRFFGGFIAGATDRVLFTADSDGELTISVDDNAGGCPADLDLSLYTSGGQLLEQDDNSGIGNCAAMTVEVAAGQYEVVVSGPADRAVGNYAFHFELTSDISAAGDYNGAFEKNGSDLYLLQLGSAQDVRLMTGSMGGGCPADTTLTLSRPGAASHIEFDDNDGAGSCSLIERNLPAGDYEVLVRGRGNFGAPGGYLLFVSFARCGDGSVDPGEACDDGNVRSGDGCSDLCQLEASCGDGNVDPGEDCDDGNNQNGDGCSAGCVVEAICGDGNVDPGEECDDGNRIDGDGCSGVCAVEATCGNGLPDPNEECDDGNRNDGDGCSSVCTIEAVCGNGSVEGDEQCDDGNRNDGDGCDRFCVSEDTFIEDNPATLVSDGFDAGEEDIYRFRIPEGFRRATIEAYDDVRRCSGNTMEIFLYRVQNGRDIIVTSKNSGGQGFCPKILNQSLVSGDYKIVVRADRHPIRPVDPYTLEFLLR